MRQTIERTILAGLLSVGLVGLAFSAPPARWSEAKANAWYAKQPWLVGSNYIPANAINELEMWQADTFDPATIDKELGWAQGLGMTTMRVFLHDLAWQQDAAGYRARIDRFLTIADRHGIKPLFVLFDSCWDPQPKLGRQHEPTPGVHNSGWLQSPGAAALQNAADYPRLEAYVTGVVGAFSQDARVLGWDVWNEPDNVNTGSYAAQEPKNKVDLVLALLPKVFQWARAAGASQPLTSGVWKGDWSTDDKLSPMERVQLENSDVISFHNYDKGDEFEKRITWLTRYHRPILCTEYMARGNGSTFQGSLPIAHKHKVAAINWGFVAGKTQTYLPWDSWKQPYVGREPAVWFHEIFRQDGTPYKQDEVTLIRSLTGAKQGVAPTKFSMAFNGFMGSADGVVLQDGVLVYTQYARDGKQQQKKITPTPEQWRQFRQTLDGINVWRWQARYPNPGGVADGLRWEIDLTYPDRKLHAEGDNNYPDDNGRPVNASQQTKAFQRLREAVQTLLGDSSF